MAWEEDGAARRGPSERERGIFSATEDPSSNSGGAATTVVGGPTVASAESRAADDLTSVGGQDGKREAVATEFLRGGGKVAPWGGPRLSAPLPGLEELLENRTDYFAELSNSVAQEIQRLLRYTLLGYVNPRTREQEQKVEADVQSSLLEIMRYMGDYIDTAIVDVRDARQTILHQMPSAISMIDANMLSKQLDQSVVKIEDLNKDLALREDKIGRMKQMLRHMRVQCVKELQSQRESCRNLLVKHVGDVMPANELQVSLQALGAINFFNLNEYIDEDTQMAVQLKAEALQADFAIERDALLHKIQVCTESEVEARYKFRKAEKKVEKMMIALEEAGVSSKKRESIELEAEKITKDDIRSEDSSSPQNVLRSGSGQRPNFFAQNEIKSDSTASGFGRNQMKEMQNTIQQLKDRLVQAFCHSNGLQDLLLKQQGWIENNLDEASGKEAMNMMKLFNNEQLGMMLKMGESLGGDEAVNDQPPDVREILSRVIDTVKASNEQTVEKGQIVALRSELENVKGVVEEKSATILDLEASVQHLEAENSTMKRELKTKQSEVEGISKVEGSKTGKLKHANTTLKLLKMLNWDKGGGGEEAPKQDENAPVLNSLTPESIDDTIAKLVDEQAKRYSVSADQALRQAEIAQRELERIREESLRKDEELNAVREESRKARSTISQLEASQAGNMAKMIEEYRIDEVEESDDNQEEEAIEDPEPEVTLNGKEFKNARTQTTQAKKKDQAVSCQAETNEEGTQAMDAQGRKRIGPHDIEAAIEWVQQGSEKSSPTRQAHHMLAFSKAIPSGGKHIRLNSDGEKCASCGDVFTDEALFCRLCGAKRNSEIDNTAVNKVKHDLLNIGSQRDSTEPNAQGTTRDLSNAQPPMEQGVTSEVAAPVQAEGQQLPEIRRMSATSDDSDKKSPPSGKQSPTEANVSLSVIMGEVVEPVSLEMPRSLSTSPQPAKDSSAEPTRSDSKSVSALQQFQQAEMAYKQSQAQNGRQIGGSRLLPELPAEQSTAQWREIINKELKVEYEALLGRLVAEERSRLYRAWPRTQSAEPPMQRDDSVKRYATLKLRNLDEESLAIENQVIHARNNALSSIDSARLMAYSRMGREQNMALDARMAEFRELLESKEVKSKYEEIGTMSRRLMAVRGEHKRMRGRLAGSLFESDRLRMENGLLKQELANRYADATVLWSRQCFWLRRCQEALEETGTRVPIPLGLLAATFDDKTSMVVLRQELETLGKGVGQRGEMEVERKLQRRLDRDRGAVIYYVRKVLNQFSLEAFQMADALFAFHQISDDDPGAKGHIKDVIHNIEEKDQQDVKLSLSMLTALKKKLRSDRGKDVDKGLLENAGKIDRIVDELEEREHKILDRYRETFECELMSRPPIKDVDDTVKKALAAIQYSNDHDYAFSMAAYEHAKNLDVEESSEEEVDPENMTEDEKKELAKERLATVVGASMKKAEKYFKNQDGEEDDGDGVVTAKSSFKSSASGGLVKARILSDDKRSFLKRAMKKNFAIEKGDPSKFSHIVAIAKARKALHGDEIFANGITEEVNASLASSFRTGEPPTKKKPVKAEIQTMLEEIAHASPEVIAGRVAAMEAAQRVEMFSAMDQSQMHIVLSAISAYYKHADVGHSQRAEEEGPTGGGAGGGITKDSHDKIAEHLPGECLEVPVTGEERQEQVDLDALLADWGVDGELELVDSDGEPYLIDSRRGGQLVTVPVTQPQQIFDAGDPFGDAPLDGPVGELFAFVGPLEPPQTLIDGPPKDVWHPANDADKMTHASSAVSVGVLSSKVSGSHQEEQPDDESHEAKIRGKKKKGTKPKAKAKGNEVEHSSAEENEGGHVGKVRRNSQIGVVAAVAFASKGKAKKPDLKHPNSPTKGRQNQSPSPTPRTEEDAEEERVVAHEPAEKKPTKKTVGSPPPHHHDQPKNTRKKKTPQPDMPKRKQTDTTEGDLQWKNLYDMTEEAEIVEDHADDSEEEEEESCSSTDGQEQEDLAEAEPKAEEANDNEKHHLVDVEGKIREPKENSFTLRFADLDFHTINHDVFKEELLDQFRACGMTEEAVSRLNLQLREGSIIVEITGDTHIIQELHNKIPKDNFQVMGSVSALVGLEAKRIQPKKARKMPKEASGAEVTDKANVVQLKSLAPASGQHGKDSMETNLPGAENEGSIMSSSSAVPPQRNPGNESLANSQAGAPSNATSSSSSASVPPALGNELCKNEERDVWESSDRKELDEGNLYARVLSFGRTETLSYRLDADGRILSNSRTVNAAELEGDEEEVDGEEHVAPATEKGSNTRRQQKEATKQGREKKSRNNFNDAEIEALQKENERLRALTEELHGAIDALKGEALALKTGIEQHRRDSIPQIQTPSTQEKSISQTHFLSSPIDEGGSDERSDPRERKSTHKYFSTGSTPYPGLEVENIGDAKYFSSGSVASKSEESGQVDEHGAKSNVHKMSMLRHMSKFAQRKTIQDEPTKQEEPPTLPQPRKEGITVETQTDMPLTSNMKTIATQTEVLAVQREEHTRRSVSRKSKSKSRSFQQTAELEEKLHEHIAGRKFTFATEEDQDQAAEKQSPINDAKGPPPRFSIIKKPNSSKYKQSTLVPRPASVEMQEDDDQGGTTSQNSKKGPSSIESLLARSSIESAPSNEIFCDKEDAPSGEKEDALDGDAINPEVALDTQTNDTVAYPSSRRMLIDSPDKENNDVPVEDDIADGEGDDESDVEVVDTAVQCDVVWRDLPFEVIDWLKVNLLLREQAELYCTALEVTPLNSFEDISAERLERLVREFESFMSDTMCRLHPTKYEMRKNLRKAYRGAVKHPGEEPDSGEIEASKEKLEKAKLQQQVEELKQQMQKMEEKQGRQTYARFHVHRGYSNRDVEAASSDAEPRAKSESPHPRISIGDGHSTPCVFTSSDDETTAQINGPFEYPVLAKKPAGRRRRRPASAYTLRSHHVHRGRAPMEPIQWISDSAQGNVITEDHIRRALRSDGDGMPPLVHLTVGEVLGANPREDVDCHQDQYCLADATKLGLEVPAWFANRAEHSQRGTLHGTDERVSAWVKKAEKDLQRCGSERTLKAARAAGIIGAGVSWPRTKEGAGQRIASLLHDASLRAQAAFLSSLRKAVAAAAASHPAPPSIQPFVTVPPPGLVCSQQPRPPSEVALSKTPRMARVWKPPPMARRHSLPQQENEGQRDADYIGCVSWNYGGSSLASQQPAAEPEPEAPVATRTMPPMQLVSSDETPSPLDRLLVGSQIANNATAAAASTTAWKPVLSQSGRVQASGPSQAALPAIVSPRKIPASREQRKGGTAREGPGWRYSASGRQNAT